MLHGIHSPIEIIYNVKSTCKKKPVMNPTGFFEEYYFDSNENRVGGQYYPYVDPFSINNNNNIDIDTDITNYSTDSCDSFDTSWKEYIDSLNTSIFTSDLCDKKKVPKKVVPKSHCMICGKKMILSSIKRHMEIHNKDRIKYHCDGCSKSFLRHDALKRHRMICCKNK